MLFQFWLYVSQCGRGELNEKKERNYLLRASSVFCFETEFEVNHLVPHNVFGALIKVPHIVSL